MNCIFLKIISDRKETPTIYLCNAYLLIKSGSFNQLNRIMWIIYTLFITVLDIFYIKSDNYRPTDLNINLSCNMRFMILPCGKKKLLKSNNLHLRFQQQKTLREIVPVSGEGGSSYIYLPIAACSITLQVIFLQYLESTNYRE